MDRGDPLLQVGDLGGERRLVADLRGKPPEQAGDLAARLQEAEDVVDQEEHVLAERIAEIFGDRQRA